MKGNCSGRWMAGIGVAMLALAGCSRQEAADWKQATLADSPEAYKLFLQEHPHSAEGTQAQSRIQQLGEQRDWQVASAADTRDSYQLFLMQHPDSKFAQEARIRIENFAQAGVAGGAALAAAAPPPNATSPSTTSGDEAAANDSSAPAGSAAGASTSNSMATALAAAPVTPAAHASHRVPAHASLAQTARPQSHRLARAGTHAVHAAHGAHGVLAHAQTPTRVLQLGAFRSRARAESEWRQLAARVTTLKGLHPRYVASRSGSGRVYRLQVRVSSAAAASGVCASLRRHSHSCVRVIA